MNLILIPLFTLLTITDPVPKSVDLHLASDLDFLVEFYKERHINAEISLEEKETSAALAKEMRSIGYTVTEGVGGYGIVAMMENGPGPQILYRTDMDALPMLEKTGLDYQSQLTTMWNGEEVGTMHSCGHDMHMTTWLGIARAMAAMKDQWKGTLMFIGQPAEEIGAGAKMMLNAGLYDKFGVPDYGLALHCNSVLETGKIGIAEGYVLANTESVDIVVKGIGAHGASPHQSIDPVVVASLIVMDIQTIVSRNLKPIDDAVITVGAIKGGTKHNIIPDEVTLQLTIRTYKEEVRQMIHQRLREISRGIAIAAGLPEELMPEVIIPEDFTPSTYNDPVLTERITTSAQKAIGEDYVTYVEPTMGGEDFSCYGNTDHDVPTVMFWLGTVPPERYEQGALPGLHSPFYFPDPRPTIETGVKVGVQSLMDLMPVSDASDGGR